MRRLTELAALTFLINLTSCVPPTEEITVAATEDLESAVAVALNENQITSTLSPQCVLVGEDGHGGSGGIDQMS